MNNLRFILLIGITSLFTFFSMAQSDDKNQFVQFGKDADSLMYSFINKGDLRKGLSYCIQKEEYFFKGESWVDYITASNDKAYLYHALDSLDQLKNAVFKNFENANKYLKSNHKEWLRAKEQINSYYYLIGDYRSARDIIKEVIQIKEDLNKNKNAISTSYFNLGTAYNRLRDTENALNSFKKSIDVKYPDGKLGLSGAERFNNIARVFISRGELDSALHYLHISESLLDTINMKGRFKKRKVLTYILLVETWLDKKNFEKADEYLSLIKRIELNNRETITWLERSSKYYHEIGNYAKSIEMMEKARKLAKESKSKYSPPHQARRIIDYAESLIKIEDNVLALESLHDGLQILAPLFNDDNLHANPESNQLFDKPDALKILKLKGRILKQMYLESGNPKNLKASYDTYSVACNVIKDVRQGIKSNDSRNDLSENTISVYEEAISVAYEMYKTTKDEYYIFSAFKLAESNKAQLLLENLNEQEARGFAGIPDSIARKVTDLQLYLATLQDRAVRKGENGRDNDLIFKTKQELELITSFLEKSYPRYYQLKYQNEPIDPAMVQDKILDDETLLIEYFVGQNQIYLFVISKEDLFMEEMEKSIDHITTITDLRNSVMTRPDDSDSEGEYQNFVDLSQKVYSYFVENTLKNVSPKVNKLIIIPDDQFNYIPFEILITEQPENENSYSLNNLSYLFESYAIHYNYSATLLNKVKSKEEQRFKANFIGYAPTFSQDDIADSRYLDYKALSNLKCNDKEVENIVALIGGTKKVGSEALKNDFLESAKEYKIIHLATHAFVDPSDFKRNKIFLQDDFLSDVNLYNLELNTELAVLSACNTGSGELLKGEGVMNLARGFINSGCSSTIMSMWSVDDCTTSDLMELFYTELKEGHNKDEALKRAKINYISSANKTKIHPYYWAAFVPFGDMKSLDLNSSWTSNPFSVGGLLLVVFGLFYFFLRKK